MYVCLVYAILFMYFHRPNDDNNKIYKLVLLCELLPDMGIECNAIFQLNFITLNRIHAQARYTIIIINLSLSVCSQYQVCVRNSTGISINNSDRSNGMDIDGKMPKHTNFVSSTCLRAFFSLVFCTLYIQSLPHPCLRACSCDI